MRYSRRLLPTLLLAACTGGPTEGPVLEDAPGEPDPLGALVDVSVGSGHACGLDDAGRLGCWGVIRPSDRVPEYHTFGRLAPVALGERFQSVVSGNDLTCALDGRGDVWCVGLGIGSEVPESLRCTGTQSRHCSAVAVRVVADEEFKKLALGGMLCGLTEGGSVKCWFLPGVGFVSPPVDVSGGHVFADFTASVSGGLCGVDFSGQLYCWLAPSWCDAPQESACPTPVSVSTELPVTALAGDDHLCVLDDDGAAFCQGDNTYGQLGVGRGGPGSRAEGLAAVETKVRFAAIDPGRCTSGSVCERTATCALDGAGRAYCWGVGNLGTSVPPEHGCGDLPCQATPRPIHAELAWNAISIGGDWACGVAIDGSVYCWGGIYGPTPTLLDDAGPVPGG